jgi:hypothetical protein
MTQQPERVSLPDVMRVWDFTVADLECNRRGELSVRQKERLRETVLFDGAKATAFIPAMMVFLAIWAVFFSVGSDFGAANEMVGCCLLPLICGLAGVISAGVWAGIVRAMSFVPRPIVRWFGILPTVSAKDDKSGAVQRKDGIFHWGERHILKDVRERVLCLDTITFNFTAWATREAELYLDALIAARQPVTVYFLPNTKILVALELDSQSQGDAN